MSNSMKIIRRLPPANEPTRAAYKKPVIGEGKYIKVLPSVYKPKPAPIPKPRPKLKAYPKPQKSRGMGKREVHREPKFWTECRVKKLIEMYDAGMTYDEIGDYFGKTKSTICGKIRRLTDSGMVSNRRNNTPWTAKDLNTMKKMRAAGKSFGEIADKLGRSPQGCYEYYRKKVSLRCKT